MREEGRFDILIIGAGASGCAVARELSRYQVDVAVLEKNSDVAGETTGRNSAVVHAGFNNQPGSAMARYCVEGNLGFEDLCRQLDVPFRRTGKLVLAFDEEDERTIRKLWEQGRANGCPGLELLDGEAVSAKMPQVHCRSALWSPQTGITDPFLYCIALAEHAAANGVRFFLNQEVSSIETADEGYLVRTKDNVYKTKFIVNCAGVRAPEVAAMAGAQEPPVFPCRGEYVILDAEEGEGLSMPVYPAPRAGDGGLGVHLTPTMEGNILIGPSAEYIDEKEDYSVTGPVLDQLLSEARQLLPSMGSRTVIGQYSGIRPKLAPPGEGGYRDFIIRFAEGQLGMIDLVGIESPGLTASAPIGRAVAELLGGKMDLAEKTDWIPPRKRPPRFRDLTDEQREALIRKDPEYGELVCRCRKVSRAEIRAAIENPLGVRSISGIKYRAWATTGRCNGGYCLPRIVDLLIREYHADPAEIRYRNPGSELFEGEVK